MTPTVVVPSVARPESLRRLLESLAGQEARHQVIVIDNGSEAGEVGRACRGREGVEVIGLPENSGYSKAVNLGVREAEGDSVILLNDDSTVEPGFVGAIAGALDPAAGVVMSAGVMLETGDSGLIDSAGMELDRTLLVFDYLNGMPRAVLEDQPPDPVGPSAAAAAFDRNAFLEVGGFDEAIFAYWEDVDLVLRLLGAGGRCRLAAEAIGYHEHSGTLGSGSARKNYLMGFGRAYVLRKWGLLPKRGLAVAARDLPLMAGQALIDRNLAGIRGRIDGYRAAPAAPCGPPDLDSLARAPGPIADLGRRLARRRRLRGRSPG